MYNSENPTIMKTSVYRKEHFNATHRLHNPNWDDEKNKRVFGSCNNPNYHGHNYDIIVKVTGDVDDETGYVIDAKILKDLIQTHVIQRYDHKNLYLDVEDFKTLNPTAENIARTIYFNLRPHIDQTFDIQVKLYETERNFVKFPA